MQKGSWGEPTCGQPTPARSSSATASLAGGSAPSARPRWPERRSRSNTPPPAASGCFQRPAGCGR
eukprot:11805009-Alexandrium_andersonii.AAC.1